MRHKPGSYLTFHYYKFHRYGYLSRSLTIAIKHSYVNNFHKFSLLVNSAISKVAFINISRMEFESDPTAQVNP